MAEWNYHRASDGSIIHGPECVPPDKYSPYGICVCDYVAPHDFIPQNPNFRPGDKTCHECGLLADDKVHK